ncbi:hypothetical protein FHS23_004528 [Prauserella isguenensis]|uniref:Uncharacterized protein n=1 Tax=Prauserella isguenensis TaxID=1470180 RepID=A0A839S6I3_9PSEU|nr:hypothetical protein [Prauserella isguenensis]MBB3053475.1 hypothetical protein [Prauserella isguenensis]
MTVILLCGGECVESETPRACAPHPRLPFSAVRMTTTVTVGAGVTAEVTVAASR